MLSCNRHKNSQDALKTAILAVNQVLPRGVEPLDTNQESAGNKELKENADSVLSTGLDKIVQKYPDLAHVVQVWKALPKHIKSKIKDLIDKYSTEGKDK